MFKFSVIVDVFLLRANIGSFEGRLRKMLGRGSVKLQLNEGGRVVDCDGAKQMILYVSRNSFKRTSSVPLLISYHRS